MPLSPTWSSLISPSASRHHRHPGEAQVLVERCHVRLVAAHPVERLGDEDLEHAAPRVLQKRLDAGTEDHAVARDGGILVRAGDLPALALRALAADPELVLDRRRPHGQAEHYRIDRDRDSPKSTILPKRCPPYFGASQQPDSRDMLPTEEAFGLNFVNTGPT